MTTISWPRRILAALSSALVVAAVALLATVLLFHAGAGADTGQLAGLFQYFVRSSVILAAAMFVFALIGVYRHWYLTIAAALVAAVVGAFFGTLLHATSLGAVIGASNLGSLLDSLIGPNLFLILFAVAAGLTAGRAIWLVIADEVPAVAERRIAIVRAPAATLAEGLVTHVKRSKVDSDLADAQWEGYLAALDNNGWDVVEVQQADDLADSVFVEDAVVVFENTAVITSPGAESRRAETEAVEALVTDLGLEVRRIQLPGTLDGGDVLTAGSTVYVGRSDRTNAAGIRQLRAIVGELGYDVVAVPLTRVLHLKSAVTALPDGTIIGYPPLVDEPSLFPRFLPVPEESGSHVVVLDAQTVLMAASAPKSIALIEDLGYTVVAVDISEFEKLEGCVTCLSVLLR
jgi:dimethylargininase